MTDASDTTTAATVLAGGAGASPPAQVIESGGRWQPIDFAELWRYRELLFFFTWRDIKVRYKQTELGAIWAILQPLATTGVFVFLFQVLMGGDRQSAPADAAKDTSTFYAFYVLSTYCGAVVWQLFADGVNRSGESLLSGSHMITKVYFPRLLLPLSTILTGLVDFAVALVPLAFFMVYYRCPPTWTLVTLPLFVALAVASALAIGLWLSALAAVYRDFRYVVPFLLRVGLFVCPVAYPAAKVAEMLPDWAMFLYSLNPMVGAIEGFRWAMLGPSAAPPGLVLIPSIAATAILLAGGAMFFHRMEQTIADVI